MRWLVIPGVAVAAVLAAVSLVVSDGSGSGGGLASNYRSWVLTVEPAAPGLELQTMELGTQTELTNRTGRTVTVLGYQDEPYLLVEADGVYENVRSPTLYVNGDERPPPDADAAAAPRWRRIDGGTTVTWHDHRVHWMGSTDPPEVSAQPDRTHLVRSWEVPLQVDDAPVTVAGRLTWVPGPRPWPWFLAVAAVGLAVVGAGLSRWRRMVLPGVLAGLVAATVIHVAGAWTTRTGGLDGQLALLALPVLATAPAALALVVRRDDERNRLLLLGATVAGLSGLVGARHTSWLSHSQLPTGLDPTLARSTVAVALGLATGALLVLAWRTRAMWRRPPSREPSHDRPDRVATGAGSGVLE